MSFLASRIRPLSFVARAIPRNKPVWACGIHFSSVRYNPRYNDIRPERPTLLASSGEDKVKAEGVDSTEEPGEPSEAEIQALAYDFPWLYDGSSHLSRIPHYPYAKAPKIWALLGIIPQSIQYLICKSACERMLRNNTSPEYFPDQFLQGAGLAMHQMIPLISTNIDREPLTHMMTQELYDRFESELEKQEAVKSEVNIKLAAIHDGMVKDVWVLLGPKLKSGSTRGFIRWRWQSLTVVLRAATDDMSSRDQVTQMMMEGVQFKVDVEFDASIDYTIKSNVLNQDVVSDFTRRPLLVRFETPFFEPADKMVASRSMSRPHEAPIDWNWRVSDIDYLLEQDFIVRRQKEDVKDEEHARREMEM
ncbi:hypothetical protein BGZ80_002736 [Entomortierella chlamydospora]|uniref:Tim44-like domain-containing protein n=1 Tax=Entomortierella chlamydospora TaxID=101097 RepID=A0A9P6T2Y5_9FUNG|nr:hypothetical protein BGZ80_002736 [Entomortierella chlamydospora]